MTAPANYDLEIYRGDSWVIVIRLKDANNLYIDLTGRVPKAQIRSAALGTQTGSPLVDITCELTNQTTMKGGVTLSMTPTQTASLPTTGKLYWDFQTTITATGFIQTFLRGEVAVDGQVTA